MSVRTQPLPRAALATVLGVLFLTFLDTTIVSVTLGDIESDIGAGVIPLQWVINGYALPFAALMLVGGSLADRYGRRTLMLAGVAVFCAGSVLAALAGDVGLVIAGRVVMGVGAAACEPGTLSIIRQLVPDRGARARALGAWSAVSGLALALGPVVGGALVGLAGWRAVFWFNVALGVLLLALVARFVPDSRDPRPGRLDVPGFVLGTLAIGSVVFAVIEGEYHGYGTAWIVALFVLGALAGVTFVLVERRAAAPMLDLALVRRPIIASALLAAFAVYFAVFALFFLTALYLDLGLGYGGWKLAGLFTPMAVTVVGGGLAAGPWVARAGSRLPAVTGCLLGAAGLAGAWLVIGDGRHPSSTALAAAMAVAGLGFGITVVPLTSSVLSHAPARVSGMAASATNTARQLGVVVGVAVLGAIANSHLVSGVDDLYAKSPIVSAVLNRSTVLREVQTGGSGGFDIARYRAQFPSILQPFIDSFARGLRVALVIAIVLMLLAAVVAAVVREPAEPDDGAGAVDGVDGADAVDGADQAG